MVLKERGLKEIGIQEYGLISTAQIPFGQEIRKICEKNVQDVSAVIKFVLLMQ